MDEYDVFISSLQVGADKYEKEEKDVEEHMTGHRDRPHSRNDAGIGLPAIWNRRKRIKLDDPDMFDTQVEGSGDPDMSLNFKSAAKPEKPEDRDIYHRISKLNSRLGKISPHLSQAFRNTEVEKLRRMGKSKAAFAISEFEKLIDESSAEYYELFRSSKNLPATISEAWKKARALSIRAGMIEALRKAAMRLNLPDSVKIPIMNSRGSRIGDLVSIRAILKPGEKISKFPEFDIDRLVALATAYKALSSNPDSISPDQVKDEKARKSILEQVRYLSALNQVTSSWHDVMSKFKVDESGRVDVSEGDWGAVLRKFNSFLNRPKAPVLDPNKFFFGVAEQLQKEFGEIPEEIRSALSGYGAPLEDLDTSTLEQRKEREKQKLKQEKAREKQKSKQKKREDRIIDRAMKELARNRAQRDKKRKRDQEYLAEARKKEDEIKSLVEKEKAHAGKWTDDEFVDEVLGKLDEKLKREKEINQAEPRPPMKAPKVGPAAEEIETERSKGRPPMSISSEASAASNKTSIPKMVNRSATYHGIVHQGHPGGPPDPMRKYDKRYFGKDQYDAIIASAKELLKQDWLKYGWGDDPGDVPARAALDLAIGVTDDGLYQSKIDANTYNMLLNQLAGWGFDVFNETVFASPKKRKASVMAINSSAQAILKIADSLRSTHPRLAVQIVKHVHDIVRVAVEPEEGQAFRQEEEKKLEDKLKSLLHGVGIAEGNDLNKLIDDIMKEVDRLEERAKVKPGVQAKVSSAQVFRAFINAAYNNPEHRKHLPLFLAAVKKNKKKPSSAEKEEKKFPSWQKEEKKFPSWQKEEKKPSSAKKEEKKPSSAKYKKMPTSKKKRASVVLASNDINW